MKNAQIVDYKHSLSRIVIFHISTLKTLVLTDRQGTLKQKTAHLPAT
jgi:hypothetical protein